MRDVYKIRQDSDRAITLVQGSRVYEHQQTEGVSDSQPETTTSSSAPAIPMYVTVPGFIMDPKFSKLNDVPGRGFGLTFMMLINPETMNIGKTGNTQYSYTRKGYVTQLWGLNLDTITANGKTAAFWAASEGLTNDLRRNSLGFLNLMSLISAYRNNGYRMVDRTQISTIKAATRVIDVVHGIQISYDGNTFLGHFNNFTLDEDAEHPYLLTYNFEFIVSLYGSTEGQGGGGMNEIYGHYLKPEDELAKKDYKIKMLSDLDRYFMNPEGASIETDPFTMGNSGGSNRNVQDMWVFRTGLPWSVAVAHGLDNDPGLMNALGDDPTAYAKMIDSISDVKPADFSRTASTLSKITNRYGSTVSSTINDISAKGTVTYKGQELKVDYVPSPELVKAIIAQESSGLTGADRTDTLESGQKVTSHGLMQVLEGTAAELGYTGTLTPQQQIEVGTKYMTILLSKYNGDEQKAMAAYNAGPGAVDRWGGVPLNNKRRGTQNYVANATLMEKYYEQENATTGKDPQQVADQNSRTDKSKALVENGVKKKTGASGNF